jgi:hypothetical protein
MTWEQVEPILRQRAYATLDNDPQSLLSGDGGCSEVADVYMARLIGFDDQLIDDIRVERPMDVILAPIPERLSIAAFACEPYAPTFRTARYVLQSGYVKLDVSAEHAPAGVRPRMQDLMFSVIYLRYRRRS